MNRTALFPGSFDPFTLGHKIVVDQGLELFERIVIAVGVNTEKRGLLTPENRARLIRDLYRNDSRIEVVIYNELTGKVTADAKAGDLVYVKAATGAGTKPVVTTVKTGADVIIGWLKEPVSSASVDQKMQVVLAPAKTA